MTCAEPGCITILSQHNPADRCFVHDKGPDGASYYIDLRDGKPDKGITLRGICYSCSEVGRLSNGICGSCRARPYEASDQMQGVPAIKEAVAR